MTDEKIIENKLRVRLAEKNMRNKELAEMIGVKPNTISRWVKGEQMGGIHTAYLICKALNIKIEDLFE